MRRPLVRITGMLLVALLASCTQQNTGDEPNNSTAPQGLNRFLLFPNPVSMNTGGFETNTSTYATAYYAAIDPTNLKDTIDKWKTQNGFGSGGTELRAVFRDTKDLGYGRNMNGRTNVDGSVAFYVENYNVTPNAASGGYANALNVEAAINRDTRWHVGTNAIEWSSTPCILGVDPTGCSDTVKFAKFYNFSSKDGTRQLAVDLDGNGLKAMPGPCITCHGGRGDPLTPTEGNPAKPRFPLVENSLSRKRGDVQARLHGMNVGSFGFSPDLVGFSRTDQEATLKTFNQWILCTYPLSATSPSDPTVDACRVPAGLNEWQGTAAEMIKSWYGGTGTNGIPGPTFLDNYVPAGWQAGVNGVAAEDLYRNVVTPFCRTCHILRGTNNQSDIDFMTVAKFTGYADRIKAHVFDRGTMPLALIVYNDFWASGAPTQLANFINPTLGALVPPQTATDSGGAALKPGRPIASPGSNRMVKTGANAILTAENSLFASRFNWSQDPNSPPGASITNADSMIAIFNATTAGTYFVRLSVDGGADTKNVTIVADNNFPDPINIKFAHVKNIIQNTVFGANTCTTCHKSAGTNPVPPVFYNSDLDRNEDGAIDPTDEEWLQKALRGRANLTEIEASPLLRKPSGNHHNGGTLLNLSDTSSGGGLSNYSILYNWILAGMQPGGVAASALVNGGTLGTQAAPLQLAFSGNPPLATGITLNGSSSIGATNFRWLVSGPQGPGGNSAIIAVPTSPTTTLSLPFVGAYQVTLQVDDGVSNDQTTRTIFAGEQTVVASFTPGSLPPATGTTPVSFTGTPTLTGTINLTSTSAGSPATCTWEVTQPAGVTGSTLDGSATLPLTKTKACGTPAVLVAPTSAINAAPYSVTMTATSQFGTSTSSLTHNIAVTAVISSPVAGNRPTTFTGRAPVASLDPISTSINLTGSSSTGPGVLTFLWQVTGPGGATIAIANNAAANTSFTTTRLGTHTATLTVDNGLPQGAGNVASVSFNVTGTERRSRRSGR